MISCKTDAAGIDCCNGWQILKSPKQESTEQRDGLRGSKGEEKFIKEGIYKN